MLTSVNVLTILLSAADAHAAEAVHRVVLSPAVVQTNSKFTQHAGVGLGYTFEFSPGFGLSLTGQYNWEARRSPFLEEVSSKTRMEPKEATQTLLRWHSLAGFEATPLSGHILDERRIRLGLFVGAGVGGSGLDVPGGSPTWLDTGPRFVSGGAVTLRAELTRNLELQLGFHAQHFASEITHVNGCNESDLRAMEGAVRAEKSHLSVPVGAGCRVAAFRPNEVPFGLSALTANPQAGTNAIVAIHLLSAGLSARF